VGEFNATDPDGDVITYHFVNGENNNSLFTLDTNGTLKTATTFDYESNASTYTVTIQAKDELNATTEGNFTINLNNITEAPYIISGGGGELANFSIPENQSFITYINTVDPEAYPYQKTYSATVNWEPEPIFTGQVVQSGGEWDDNLSISFEIEDSSGNQTYPFQANGVFNPNVQIPKINVSFDGSISSLSPTYFGGYNSTGSGFAGGAPEIRLSNPALGGTQAKVNALVSEAGEITGFVIVDAGSDYGSLAYGQTAPKATVIGGPHFVKIVDQESNFTGRTFLITNNTRNSVTLDMSQIEVGESNNPSTYFPAGTKVEIIPAPTLGSVMGVDFDELPTGWKAGIPDSSDWLYLWDPMTRGWYPYHFLNASYEGSGWARGWYSQRQPASGPQNNLVLYKGRGSITPTGSITQHAGHDLVVFKRTPGSLSVDSGKMTIIQESVQINNGLVFYRSLAEIAEGGADQEHFQLHSSGLLSFVNPPDFENPTDANSDGIYEVVIELIDNGFVTKQTINVTVTDALENTSPINLVSDALMVSENQPVGTIIGEFIATDPDANATLSYALVDGNGSNGYSYFNLDPNGTLKSAAVFDYENNESNYSIRVQVRDEHNASLEKKFVINLLNEIEDLDGDGIEDFYDLDDDNDGFSDAEEISLRFRSKG
jgi:hypothetical protein